MPRNGLGHSALMAMYKSDKYSDLKIVCGDREFPVHRNVVCHQSEFFEKALSGPFQEATTRIIKLPDDEPDDIARLVDYLYRQDYFYTYPPPEHQTHNESSSESSKLVETDRTPEMVSLEKQMTNVAMYALGEKYMLPGLKDLAIKKFRLLPERDWAAGISTIIRQVYNTSLTNDTGLRKLVLESCVRLEGSTCVSFQDALDDTPEANVDYLKTALDTKDKRIQFLECELSKVLQRNDELVVAEENMAMEIGCLNHEIDGHENTHTRVVLEHQATKRKWEEFTRMVNKGYCQIPQCEKLYDLKVNAAMSDYGDQTVRLVCRKCLYVQE